MPHYDMRRARPDQLNTVMSLLDQRTTWLHDSGTTDQWSTREFGPSMLGSLERGETWLLWEGNLAVATITLTTIADSDFWTPEERLTPAVYLSKLATALDRKGQGLGRLLIDWTAGYATDRGFGCLRWDVWRTNEQLQAYYRHLGATHLRTMNVPGRNSGALFHWPLAAPRDLDISTAVTFGAIATLPSRELHRNELVESAIHGLDSAGNQSSYEYIRLVDNWVTPSLGTPPTDSNAVRSPVLVSTRPGPELYDAGDGWRLHGFFSQPAGPNWPDELDRSRVRSGHLYQLQLTFDHQQVQVHGDLDLISR